MSCILHIQGTQRTRVPGDPRNAHNPCSWGLIVLSGKFDSKHLEGTMAREWQGAPGWFHLSGRAWAQGTLPSCDTGWLMDSEQPVLGGMPLRPDNLGQGCRKRNSSIRHEEGLNANR